MQNSCKECILKQNNNDKFITWLVENLGPLLYGTKPSELISLPICDKKVSNKLNIVKNCMKKCNKLSYKIFSYNQSSIKVFFYNPMVLDNCLKDHRNTYFFKSLGYPDEYKMDSYLEHIISKMKNGRIPDEIGIFLGYPLKDVMGFIGHSSLKLTKVNGWRVYGDPRISDEKFNSIINAKKMIKELLKYDKPENILFYI